ncbi:MAG: hypothetical protein AAF673_06205 [Pseudomonadota bacterium]
MTDNLKNQKVKSKERKADLSSALRKNLLRRKSPKKTSKEKSDE